MALNTKMTLTIGFIDEVKMSVFKLCIPQSIQSQKDKVTIVPTQGYIDSSITKLTLAFDEPKGGKYLSDLVNEALKLELIGGVNSLKDFSTSISIKLEDSDNNYDINTEWKVSAVKVAEAPTKGPSVSDKLTGGSGMALNFDFKNYSSDDWIKLCSISGWF